jgi:hypothetical protein
MGTLVFACAKTGRIIDSGIDTDPRTLSTVQAVNIRIRCPHCGAEHEPRVKEGRIADAA